MRICAVVACALAATASAARAQGASADSLLGSLRARIAAEAGAEVGLYYRDLTGRDSVTIGADTRFHAASTMKVPVMIQVFRDVDAGRLRLDTPVRVINEFRSIADGSTYALDSADDSDRSLYGAIGREVRVGELARLMITRSSNLAANLLIGLVDTARVQATMRDLGADSMRVLRGVEDGPAFRAGLVNTTTARALGTIFAAIVDARAASAESCGRMLRILEDTEDNKGIPAGLPRRTRFAHKTGEITAVRHDAGVAYVGGHPRYILVILTRGIADIGAANRLLADLAGQVHAHAAAR